MNPSAMLAHCKSTLPRLSPSGFQFFEASAKDNINVKQVFERLVDVICDKMNESMEEDMSILPNHSEPGGEHSSLNGRGSCNC